MQQSAKIEFSNCSKLATNEGSLADYENSIKALNSLQSNAQYLKVAQKQRLSHSEEYYKSIVQTQKFLIRSEVTLEMLDTLPVIHVTGTKGKGTTCAMSESILRHYGLKTGFYSSPHLVEVRERIRINGEPLDKATFSKHFWQVYNKLEKEKAFSHDMPMYFQFLTILAFKVFLIEKVDVAIIEVGIGGEYDSTNILRNVPVAGITSLGLDHTTMLGNTLENIAWHKSGIMKPNSHVFTVSQTCSVLKVLTDRSIEKQVSRTFTTQLNSNCTFQSSLTVVKPYKNLTIPKTIHQPVHVYELNLSLALAVCEAWMKMTKWPNFHSVKFIDSDLTKLAVEKCKWPGRYQILRRFNNQFYLDGAHTFESLQICVEWFKNATSNSSQSKVLIFNVSGERDSKMLIAQLQQCNFEKVYFVPNKATPMQIEDHVNYNTMDNQQMAKCYLHSKSWRELEPVTAKTRIKVLPTVVEALQDCESESYNILITGSLHLVGIALSLLDPNLTS
ncbi:hypothetical protein FQA39_LY02505 [Lamprigera yunnana]|nr:hypothetical protein FQA39_LY02505 [Lamprigera yunnana]